ncbi:spore germination protein GerPC [Paenibacillus sp. NEAU-GSW1]|uniref:spore germination protein GerPC n=1 Tax=Paenibacillus sp. NEAU-GSW1 TaxID=2682486 RepID=UPI0012E28028|nr:spore germination protein GerPC [Paenibacillus sp. NEAU-GSW1]MUT66716.1 hypothetical protein [Paenibacillus sp. NEAU-GSW1]
MQQQPNGFSPWQAWSHEVQLKLQRQEAQILSLEQRLAAVCEQLKQLENKPTYNIENLQYHFDQLKVEKLEGTLNIGMTPPGDNSLHDDIEQLAVPNVNAYPKADSSITPPDAPFAEVRAKLDRYLEADAPQKLMQYEKEVGLPLDPYHRRMIINDIRKQLPTRIQYYMEKTKSDFSDLTEEDMKTVLFAKTAKDADAAMLQYLRQLQNS